jgi:hypothetical protein
MTNEETLDKGLARAGMSVADLIFLWRSGLRGKKRATLEALEARGCHVGVAFVPLPGGRWAARFVATDTRQQAYPLDTIEQLTATLAN